MRIGIAHWKGRVAPVFDVARQVLLLEIEDAGLMRRSFERLPGQPPTANLRRIAELGVETLICGAISRPLEESARTHGIRVVGFVAGELDEVIDAWSAGAIESPAYAMPGCRRPWRSPQGRSANGRGPIEDDRHGPAGRLARGNCRRWTRGMKSIAVNNNDVGGKFD